MKRFYCTICKKVKRVRNLPANTVSVSANDPNMRVGTCDKHSAVPVVHIKKSELVVQAVVKATSARKSKRTA